MTDDWKDIDRIKSKPKTREERNTERNSMAQRLAHKRRQAAGEGMSQSGGGWAKQISIWHKQAMQERGTE